MRLSRSSGIVSPSAALSTIRQRLSHGITWTFAATLCTQGGTFLANIIIANMLGREVFGEFGMVRSTLLTVAMVLCLASGLTASKYVAEFRMTDKARAGRIVALCSLVTSVMALVATLGLSGTASWLAQDMLKAPHLTWALVLAAGVTFFLMLTTYQSGVLAGLEDYRSLAGAGLVGMALLLTVTPLACRVWGLQGALVGMGANVVAQWAGMLWLVRRGMARQGIAADWRHAWRERRILWDFALPAAMTGFTTFPALWLGSTVLARQANGFQHVGLYNAAENIRILAMLVPQIVWRVALSVLSNQKGVGDDRRYRRVVWAMLTLMGGAAAVGSIALALAGPWALAIFGRDFTNGQTALLLLLLSAVPESLALAGGQVVLSHARMWLYFWGISVPKDLLIIVLALLLVPHWQAEGLAAAYAGAWIVACVSSLLLARAMLRRPIAVPAGVVQ